MILLPADAARAWQTDSHVSRAEQFEVGADIYQYATDKSEGGFKGETYLVKAVKPARRTIKVARIESGENADPEPAGWGRLDAILRNEFETGVAAQPVKLGEGKLGRLQGRSPDRKRLNSSGGTNNGRNSSSSSKRAAR